MAISPNGSTVHTYPSSYCAEGSIDESDKGSMLFLERHDGGEEEWEQGPHGCEKRPRVRHHLNRSEQLIGQYLDGAILGWPSARC